MPRKSIYLGPRRPTSRRFQPLVIPQNPERPLNIRQRDLVRHDLIRHEPWWFTKHKRGPKRENLGGDPRELRAVPKDRVRGTILERIIYLYLSSILREEFDYQSSLDGGRLELGGIVADFILPRWRLILNPVGPTHDVFVQQRKDAEQQQRLAEMGYEVVYIEEADIENEYIFEEIMRRIFNLGPRFGSSAFGATGNQDLVGLAEARALLQRSLDLVRSF